MAVRHVEDLEAWRLANDLKREVYALLATEPAASDFRFCHQLRESAASAPRNISEGFGRFRPAVFAQFLEIAIGSVMETQASLQDGVDRGHFTPAATVPARALAERTLQVSTKLLTLSEARENPPSHENVERRT
jgi:four helix bundle protein